MIDIDMLAKLKKENSHLRQQITFQSNDVLSDSKIRMRNVEQHRTIDHHHETITSEKSAELPHIGSQGNTHKFMRNYKKEDTKSLAARTDDSVSQNRSTFNRGTGVSFPHVSRGSNKGSNKILERIL